MSRLNGTNISHGVRTRSATAKRMLLAWGVLSVLLSVMAGRSVAQPVEGVPGANTKAGTIITVIRSTDWPEGAFKGGESPVVVSVMGEGEMMDRLTRAAFDQRVRGRAVEVRRLASLKPASGKSAVPEAEMNELFRHARESHVLFICESERDRVEAILRGVGKASVLTISDVDEFTSQGGMLGLSIRGGQVVIDSNLEKIQSAQLKISAQLLRTKEADRASTIKAGMVLNFIRYTEWPEASFPGPASPIVIFMLGEGEMTDVLRRAVVDQQVRGRPLEVRQLTGSKRSTPASPGAAGGTAADGMEEALRRARDGHVLFVCNSERERLPTVLRGVEGSNVLTVSDIESFAAKGGMLGLTIRRKRVAFDANPDEVRRTGLKVSSQLLRLANTVKTREQ